MDGAQMSDLKKQIRESNLEMTQRSAIIKSLKRQEEKSASR
jgi:hypothetical protein